MSWTDVADVLAAACFVVGCALAFVAAVGLTRFPDLLARMHAATKPQVLGLILMVLGLALVTRTGQAAGLLLLVLVFQMITAPVAAHMVGRAGYRTRRIRHDLLLRDELTLDLDAAQHHAPQEDAAGTSGDAPGATRPGNHP